MPTFPQRRVKLPLAESRCSRVKFSRRRHFVQPVNDPYLSQNRVFQLFQERRNPNQMKSCLGCFSMFALGSGNILYIYDLGKQEDRISKTSNQEMRALTPTFPCVWFL